MHTHKTPKLHLSPSQRNYFCRSTKIIPSLSTVAAHSRVRNRTFLPVVTFPKRTKKELIELNGNMLFLHMHSVSHSLSGGKVIPNVSVRMVRSLRDESVLKRLMKSIEECRQTCSIFILPSER